MQWAEVNEQELLTLVPKFENAGIRIGASHAPVAARRHLQQLHPLHGVADHFRVVDDTEIDDRNERSVDIVLHALLKSPAEFPVADESRGKPLFEQRLGVERLPAHDIVAGALCYLRELSQGDNRQRGRKSEMLLVLLPLLPDGGIGGDDQSI